MGNFFCKVTYTCVRCGAIQRIPLRRIHFFERFHGMEHGEPLLIGCPNCGEGLQFPTPYRTHNGHEVRLEPDRPPSNAVIHRHDF